MTTKQMDCALELSHTLNFSRAAENLFISQPALTYQIQCLENEIGFRLFERTGKGADLTPAGARFCTELRRIRTELKAAVEQGQNMSSQYSEALHVCIPMRSCIYFLPQIMQNNLAELNSLLAAYERVSELAIYPTEFEKTPKRSIKRYLYSPSLLTK